MSVETATYINTLDSTLPLATDQKSEGDNHLRVIKGAVKTTFPNVAGAVNASHTELNQLTGSTNLTALAALATNGMLVKTAANALATRTLTAGAGVTITNGDGISANPVIAMTPTVGTGDMLGPGSAVDHSLAVFNGTTGKVLQDGGVDVANVATISGTQTLQNKSLTTLKTVGFNTPQALATTTGAVTVDWTNNQNAVQAEPTGAITYTFNAPAGPCHLQLLIASDGVSTAQVITWPATVKWLGYTWAGVNNKNSIINFWWDGASYWATGSNQV
jgi:hypothetical protein